jgi:hypothetical protein
MLGAPATVLFISDASIVGIKSAAMTRHDRHDDQQLDQRSPLPIGVLQYASGSA